MRIEAPETGAFCPAAVPWLRSAPPDLIVSHDLYRQPQNSWIGTTMAKYLISFPGAAMNVPDSELERVGRDARAVIREAKEAGVYVFGGGIDETVPPPSGFGQRLSRGGRLPVGASAQWRIHYT